MATRIWKGSATAVAQVTQWVFGGTWEATDVINLTIGSKVVSVVAGSTVITTIVDTIVTALQASAAAEFAEITWSRSGNNLVGTATTTGVPFTCSITTTETGGGGADAQTIDGGATSAGTDSVACSGPNFANVAANWDGGLPVDGDDVVFANSSVDVLYGLANSAVTPNSIRIDRSYTGKIGLPRYNSGGYYEYRGRFLQYCVDSDADNTPITVGQGEGQGSSRILLDTGDAQVTINIYATGQPETQGTPAFCWKGTHADNALNVNRGSVGVAFFPGEVATVTLPRVGFVQNEASDAQVWFGSGTTITTGIEQSGGVVYASSNVGTVNKTGGELHVDGAATATALNIDGGTVYWRSTGTITVASIGNDGTLDFSQDMRGRTLTNCTISYGGGLVDPYRTLTYSNPITISRAKLSEVRLDLGQHITLDPAAA